MRWAARAWLLAAVAALAASACGQKGPLYLPDKGGKVVTSTPPVAAPQPAAPSGTSSSEAAPAAAPAAAPPAPPAQLKPADKNKGQDGQDQPPKP